MTTTQRNQHLSGPHRPRGGAEAVMAGACAGLLFILILLAALLGGCDGAPLEHVPSPDASPTAGPDAGAADTTPCHDEAATCGAVFERNGAYRLCDWGSDAGEDRNACGRRRARCWANNKVDHPVSGCYHAILGVSCVADCER